MMDLVRGHEYEPGSDEIEPDMNIGLGLAEDDIMAASDPLPGQQDQQEVVDGEADGDDAAAGRGSAAVAAPRALILLFAGLLFAAPAGGQGGSGDLTVVVTGLGSDAGSVRVALLDSEAAFENDAPPHRSGSAKPSAGRATVVFEGVAHGTYAVKLFHDENDNEKLDTNFVGIPKEPIGFSNNAMGRFGPPSFDAVTFAFDAPAATIEIVSREL